jgi:hypothetical protein
MADIIIHFLSPVICLTLLTMGIAFRNYVLGIISGIGFLSISVNTFINVVPDISSLENTILGSIYFALGAYVFVVGSIEYIQELAGDVNGT